MGYLTTITVYNDALGTFKEKPKEFAEAIFDGIDKAFRQGTAVSVPCESYANYISVQPSRHADDKTLYLHSGNCVFNLNSWNKDFENLAMKNTEWAEEAIEEAESILEEAKSRLKKFKST